MHFIASVAVFLTFFVSCQAEIMLVKGVNQTVQFDGSVLLMEFNNPRGHTGTLALCFGSHTAKAINCPHGYTEFVFQTKASQETYKLNRQGLLTSSGGVALPMSEVQFGDDGSINVLINEMPNGATMALPNAYVPVSTTTTIVAPSKVAAKKTGILMLFVTILVVVVVIVGITAGYFCFCRRKKNQTVALNDQLGRGQEKMYQQTGQPKAGAQKPPSAITTTRTTTSKTKASEEKPRVNSILKPTQSTTASSIDCISIRPATTQESIIDSKYY